MMIMTTMISAPGTLRMVSINCVHVTDQVHTGTGMTRCHRQVYR